MNSFFMLNTTNDLLPYSIFYDNGLEAVSGHWHKEVEVVLCKSGKTDMQINGKSYTLEKGEIGIALGGDVHSYSASKDHTRLVIIFDLSIFDNKSFEDISLRKKIASIARVSCKWDPKVRKEAADIITRLEELNVSSEYGAMLDIWARFCDLILLMCNKIKEDSQSGGVYSNFNQVKLLEGFEEVFQYVEQHYREKITLEDVANILNFNPSYFTRIFHKITGNTFTEYLNSYRINKARDLLIKTNASISEISYLVGFGSVKSFNRVFKKQLGMTCTAYRKNCLRQQ